MYLLYLDDSGSVANKSENYVVLAGVCIFERGLYWITKRLDCLAAEIYPEDPNAIEFHASEIFSGRERPWNSIQDRRERINIIRKVLQCLDEEPSTTVIFGCAVHKDSFPNHDPIELAFEDLCSRFDLFLKRLYHTSNEAHQGIIIFDKSTYETSLQLLSIKFRQLGTRWGRNIRNINEVPLFVESRASRIIQLADHIAYAIFRRYEAGDLNYFNCIEGRFDAEEGKIHGLVHKQHYNPRCTCPACISRLIPGPQSD